jgi:hypothetical protein
MDPDPGVTKAYGSYRFGSGSATLKLDALSGMKDYRIIL